MIVAGAVLIAFNLAGALAPQAIVPVFVLTTVLAATYASGAPAIARDRKALLFLGAWSFLFAGAIAGGAVDPGRPAIERLVPIDQGRLGAWRRR